MYSTNFEIFILGVFGYLFSGPLACMLFIFANMNSGMNPVLFGLKLNLLYYLVGGFKQIFMSALYMFVMYALYLLYMDDHIIQIGMVLFKQTKYFDYVKEYMDAFSVVFTSYRSKLTNYTGSLSKYESKLVKFYKMYIYAQSKFNLVSDKLISKIKNSVGVPELLPVVPKNKLENIDFSKLMEEVLESMNESLTVIQNTTPNVIELDEEPPEPQEPTQSVETKVIKVNMRNKKNE